MELIIAFYFVWGKLGWKFFVRGILKWYILVIEELGIQVIII